MTLMKRHLPINIYEDENAIRGTILKLRQQYPAQKYGDLEIPFDNHGNLLRDGYVNKRIWNYQQRKYIATNKFEVKKDNEEFVDAIRFIGVMAYGVRKGRVEFKHPDERETFMSNKHFEEIAHKMVRGWVIGRFRYIKFYGAFGLECVEVLV